MQEQKKGLNVSQLLQETTLFQGRERASKDQGDDGHELELVCVCVYHGVVSHQVDHIKQSH